MQAIASWSSSRPPRSHLSDLGRRTDRRGGSPTWYSTLAPALDSRVGIVPDQESSATRSRIACFPLAWIADEITHREDVLRAELVGPLTGVLTRGRIEVRRHDFACVDPDVAKASWNHWCRRAQRRHVILLRE